MDRWMLMVTCQINRHICHGYTLKTHIIGKIQSLTCKEPTVIHFLLLLAHFHFLIHFLFFSSNSKTQKIQMEFSVSLVSSSDRFTFDFFFLPPDLPQWFRYNIFWSPKILHRGWWRISAKKCFIAGSLVTALHIWHQYLLDLWKWSRGSPYQNTTASSPARSGWCIWQSPVWQKTHKPVLKHDFKDEFET